jgi:hypothetical protein
MVQQLHAQDTCLYVSRRSYNLQIGNLVNLIINRGHSICQVEVSALGRSLVKHKKCLKVFEIIIVIITVIIIFLHRLDKLTCYGTDALSLFSRASKISSSSRFVVELVFRKSGVVHYFKIVDPVCLCLNLTYCIPEISSSFLITSPVILSSLVYPSTLIF